MPAHEFGHLVGMNDHYSSSGADPGWSSTLMGDLSNITEKDLATIHKSYIVK